MLWCFFPLSSSLVVRSSSELGSEETCHIWNSLLYLVLSTLFCYSCTCTVFSLCHSLFNVLIFIRFFRNIFSFLSSRLIPRFFIFILFIFVSYFISFFPVITLFFSFLFLLLLQFEVCLSNLKVPFMYLVCCFSISNE